MSTSTSKFISGQISYRRTRRPRRETHDEGHKSVVHDEGEYVPEAIVVAVRTGRVGQALGVVRVQGVYSYLVCDDYGLDRREALVFSIQSPGPR